MRPDRRSRTAEATAAMRAVHQWIDQQPPVLEDPFAARLLAPVATAFPLTRRLALAALRRRAALLLAVQGRRLPLGTRRMRAQVLTRSRFAEDLLMERMEEGCDQFVLLGAGLDTFALRRRDLADRLRVFEVDHPETQSFKRARLEQIGEQIPGHVEFVPCDFEVETLEGALRLSGYDPSRPAVLSWLGVTYYLSRDAIRSTLATAGGMAAGSRLVFDYWTTQDLAVEDVALLETVKASVAAQGEPMRSFPAPGEVAAEAVAAGLAVERDLSASELGALYLTGRRDGLEVPGFSRLAVVAPA